MNLVDLFHSACAKYPKDLALITESTEYTYEVLHSKTHGVAERLVNWGIHEGDFVGLWMENGAEFITCYYGIQHIGAVVVPIDPMAVTRETEFIIKNAGCRLLLTSPHYAESAEELRQHLPDIQIVVLHARLSDGRSTEPYPLTANENSLAKIIYTSGTTGTPKGTMLTHGNLMANIESVAEVLNIHADTRMLCILPLFHSFAAMVNMLTPLAKGGKTVLLRQFRPETTMRAVETYRITTLCAVPSMFLYLAKIDPAVKYDLSTLQNIVSGGAGLPPKIGEVFFKRFGKEIHEGYGLSEASPVVAVNPLDQKNVTGSIGLPIPGVEVKIVNERGETLPTDEIGELAVRGKNVMQGYLNLPEETAQVLKKGWLLTGDMAQMDANGYVYIVDRKKEMVLVRGHNVYPREVENILYQHPGIAECAVVGAPDDKSGEVVRAVVVPKEPGTLTPKEIREFCADKLTSYKIPKIIEFMDALPKTTTGKILKRALTQRK